jgi:hypothetical protein
MNDAQVYEMQVKIWKPNTWGVTALSYTTSGTIQKGRVSVNQEEEE